MKKRTFIIYSGYIWTKALLGLTFQPYRWIKETMRRPILFPVIFTPLLGIIVLFLLGKIASHLVFVSGILREAIAVFLSTTLLSILFWQLLLLYLFVSFLLASWKDK